MKKYNLAEYLISNSKKYYFTDGIMAKIDFSTSNTKCITEMIEMCISHKLYKNKPYIITTGYTSSKITDLNGTTIYKYENLYGSFCIKIILYKQTFMTAEEFKKLKGRGYIE